MLRATKMPRKHQTKEYVHKTPTLRVTFLRKIVAICETERSQNTGVQASCVNGPGLPTFTPNIVNQQALKNARKNIMASLTVICFSKAK